MEDAQSAAKYAHEDADAARKLLIEIKGWEADASSAQDAFNRASASVDSATLAKGSAVRSAISAIEQDISAAQRDYNSAKATVDAYTAQGEAVDLTTLEDAVTTNEKTLQSLIIELSKTKKEDDLTNQGNSLDLKSQQLQIQQKRDAVEKLRKDSGTVTVTSENDGIVSAVNFAAGDEVMDGNSLAEITLTNSGYVVEFTVTAEQARRVKIGVEADITNGYYSDIKARLISSKADVKDPSSQKKLLTFDVSGKDVTPGQLLALSIPCSSQNYDCVIPSSALQSDNDGKFVLILKSKSTPLGNRYYASRVNVNVLAQDDINSAVQGDLEASDYVITTAEKPIKPGDQVRMEES
jgi:multidrug resistance efflux pump